MSNRIEFRVRPVIRYAVTKYVHSDSGGVSSSNVGEFQNTGLANSACKALAVQDQIESLRNVEPSDDATHVYYKLHSNEYDETEFNNSGLIWAGDDAGFGKVAESDSPVLGCDPK